MNCPDCKGIMKEIEYEGVAIEVCSSCESVWLDRGEVAKIVERRKEKFTPDEVVKSFKNRWKHEERKKAIVCPKCGIPLENFDYCDTGVMLDRCSKKHGIWMDEGELGKVQMIMEEFERSYSKPRPKPKKVKIKERKCPRCDKLLFETEYEGIEIDVCSVCEGVWLDSSELEEVIERREKKFAEEEIEAFEKEGPKLSAREELIPSLKCILCGDLMKRKNYSYSSGVIIDKCLHGHGIWFDKGEIEKIQILIERGEATAKETLLKFKPMLDKIMVETKARHEEMIKSIRVSRFGPVNKFMQNLVRKELI